MPDSPTKQELEQALDILMEANRHAKTKGEALKQFVQNHFGATCGVSFIISDQQLGNRVSEQFRYRNDIVILVCDMQVNETSLLKYIDSYLYDGLAAVLVVYTDEATHSSYTYSKLLCGRAHPFIDWCVGALSVAKSKLFHGIGTTLTATKTSHWNRVLFGAPGTGKSHLLNEQAEKEFYDTNIERVTFFPTYSYASFFGTYKPVENGGVISYRFSPGPFIRILTKALLNPSQKYLLILEELNRANAPAVFGDVFQLLDRTEDGISKFPIVASENVKTFFQSEGLKEDNVFIPDNLYIWATMNSADQGVFPLDTAFKRRWNFEFIGIDVGSTAIDSTKYPFWNSWNEIRKEINSTLLQNDVNEDKLLGPFFLGLDPLRLKETFVEAFANKVLMYLYEDAGRFCRPALFAESVRQAFSKVYETFSNNPTKVFAFKLPASFESVIVPAGSLTAGSSTPTAPESPAHGDEEAATPTA